MDLKEIETVSEIAQIWLSAVAVIIGGYWVRRRFVMQRDSYPKIEFGLELVVLGRV